MSGTIRLDYNNMMASSLGERGIDPGSWPQLAASFSEAHAAVERRRAAGEIGFFELPYLEAEASNLRTQADGLAGVFDNVVVLGIGGSALGAAALHQALCRPFWNELDDQGRDYYPRLYVLDNVDPATLAPLLDRLELRRTLFNVVSKSGTTTETMAQYLVFADRLRALLPDGDHKQNLVFTTDPSQGLLRSIAREEGITVLAVPPAVGGRFSVLSPVGLFPAALVGVDVEALLAGARSMDAVCRTDSLEANPAGLFATLQYTAHMAAGAAIHVLMPYADPLVGIADWFRQLWAESLGKRVDRQGREVFRGPTPVTARGATDQHSQIQLFMEGPFDKSITFLTAADRGSEVEIPPVAENLAALDYLGGQSLGRLLDAELTATAGALTRSGRANMTITLPRVDAHSVGQLLMLFQLATVYAGELYDVDPFDQPGVELGKVLTRGLLAGTGQAADQQPADPRWRVG